MMNGLGPQRFDEPLDVDDIPEFHASRLLLLLSICGTNGGTRITGRLKLAKLDFFLRYPSFLELGLTAFQKETSASPDIRYQAGVEGVESSMIRYRYGPWDLRYKNLLSILTARGLMKIGKGSGDIESYTLTPRGKELAEIMSNDPVFRPIVERCEILAVTLAKKNGTYLRDFIYRHFPNEVGSRQIGEVIEPQHNPTQGE